MTQALGKLYALGVGPGASDLLTLRAVKLLQHTDVIAIPEKKAGSYHSFAWDIVCGALEEETMRGERLFLHFPMTKNSAVTIPAFQQAGSEICARLKAGLDVLFITEGDPSVFSTWSYVLEEINEQLPEAVIDVVPAITSITAVAAATGIPLGDGEERFCVVPATYGIEMLPHLVEEFDTILLMKVGRMIEPLKEILAQLDLLSCATYVSHASMEQQQICRDLNEIPAENRYFSMVQISIRKRRGFLRNNSNAQTLEQAQ